MSKGTKPTPPPLDAAEQTAAAGSSTTSGNAPHAESGKATAEDAARASAAAAAASDPRRFARDTPAPGDEVPPPTAGEFAAARTTPAPAPPAVTEAANQLAGGLAIPAVPVDASAKPGALISQRSGQYLARPDPTKPISTTEPVVQGNWVGRYEDEDGNPCPAHVKHGTPLSALPRDLVREIVGTRKQVVGVLPPKQPDNPFTP